MSKTISFGLASPKPDFLEQFVECFPHTTMHVHVLYVGVHVHVCRVYVVCMYVQTRVTFGAVSVFDTISTLKMDKKG